MSEAITVEEAQAKFPELIERLSPGEEIVITQNQRPVAKLIGERSAPRQRREPGNCQGIIKLAVEDEEHLKDFEDYMP
jgi:prevent-host-death family protein